ncbi:hypothetical protein B7494_g3869 [Chlorociboria aeruginascens]|nr:hypothetical protein B7494_g3869 [Chlorociboria aeruginascens]
MSTSENPSAGVSPAVRWQDKLETYGNGHPALLEFINSHPLENLNSEILAEAVTITSNINQRTTTNRFQSETGLMEFLSNSPDEPHVRAITVHHLTRPLIRLLGARFEMDYELWTARFQPSDREYFAGPLNEQGLSLAPLEWHFNLVDCIVGPRHFTHFNLACVGFYRATTGNDSSSSTPESFLQNRRINHTVRLMRLIDTNPLRNSNDTRGPRMYIIRRISGHLRREGSAWTFLFFCDQVPTFEQSHYVSDIPAQSMPCLTDWIAGSLNDQTPNDHYDRLIQDGFGLVVKVLREIKSSWKLLLTDFEIFLEEISDNFVDEDFIRAAGFLGQRFLLNLDYFQRQLLHQQRYINFLTTTPGNIKNSIFPVVFIEDLKQEANALLVVNKRLQALRDRTKNILNIILNLNGVKQARLASEMAQLQREDAAISFRQGESIRHLTILTMLFLPPSLVAAIYGMNTNMTHDTQFWSFLLASSGAITITIAVVVLKVQKAHPLYDDIETGNINTPRAKIIRGQIGKILNWIRTHRLTIDREGGMKVAPLVPSSMLAKNLYDRDRRYAQISRTGLYAEGDISKVYERIPSLTPTTSHSLKRSVEVANGLQLDDSVLEVQCRAAAQDRQFDLVVNNCQRFCTEILQRLVNNGIITEEQYNALPAKGFTPLV